MDGRSMHRRLHRSREGLIPIATFGRSMSYATRYAEIKAYAPHGLRGTLRNVALDGLSLAYQASGRVESALQRPRVQFLYIHHTFADELAGLEQLIKDLARHHCFISHTEAAERVRSGAIDKPYIAFSSDDGFMNNLDGGRLLHAHGISACFFVNPGLIGLRDMDQVRRICAERLHFPPVEFLGWDDVAELQKMGHEIGSHSMEHRNLGVTPTDVLLADLQESRSILIERCGNVKHFAFPYGRFTNLTLQGFRDVFAVGYESCASAERGCHVPSDAVAKETLCLRRDHVVLDWPLAHVRYFLANNALKASPANNLFPA